MGGRLGVIGGSGLYDMEALTDVSEQPVHTPYGDPSDAPLVGHLDGLEVVFIARHGRGHRLSPSEVPYRANVWALKSLGVEWVLSVSAVGSLAEAIQPGHVVAVDQFIDRTRGRPASFFGDGVVAHVPFGDPTCDLLRRWLLASARAAGATVHAGGTYVCIEGPTFSTRAESHLYRSWGADVVGMTNLPEARLVREAEMSYATLALATDYDCWHPDHGEVDVAEILAILRQNTALARATIRELAHRVAAHEGDSPYQDALRYALITDPEYISEPRRRALDLLIGKYVE